MELHLKSLDIFLKVNIMEASGITSTYSQFTAQTMKQKGRPRKKKIIHQQPSIDHFSPKGRPGRPDEAVVAMEEYEAIRLYDYLGMHQKRAAEMMGISQQSFSRIVRKARKKVSDALVNAKIIRIDGGDFVDKRSLDIANKLRRSAPVA